MLRSEPPVGARDEAAWPEVAKAFLRALERVVSCGTCDGHRRESFVELDGEGSWSLAGGGIGLPRPDGACACAS